MKESPKKVWSLDLMAKKLRSQYRAFSGSRKLRKMIKSESALKIIVGASGTFDKGWIPTDIEYLNILNTRHWAKYFQNNSIDAILAEHVWEHMTRKEGLIAALHCYEYLRPGGYLRAAVPDGLHPDPTYIEWVKVGGTGAGADDHKMLYTYETFRDLFKSVGFEIQLLEYFDQDGNFHFVDWDPAKGILHRSKRFDPRNRNGNLNYTSIILDAYKLPTN